MALTTDDLAAAVARLAIHLPQLEQDLNRADAKLGDGDTGTMLSRVISAMAMVSPPADDLGAAFSAYGRATATATGSSLGTLIATGLLAAAKLTKGDPAVSWEQVSPILESARDAMLTRGGAKLGDKTVLDGLDAVATATREIGEPASIALAAKAAALEVLEKFRDRPNRIGRARMFEDGSKGLDDPGMLALARLTEIIGGQ